MSEAVHLPNISFTLILQGQEFTDPSDSNYVFKYDENGNLVRIKKGEKLPGNKCLFHLGLCLKIHASPKILFETIRMYFR